VAAGTYIADLFSEHSRMVLGLCRLLLRDPVEAEDAAQQVFLSAHRAVLRGALPREEPAWLAAIARNECRARIRERMREPLALPELPSDLPDPLASAIRAVDLDAFWKALSSLPRRQRRAVLLRELGGLSYDELGRALGVSHSAVESLLFRARQQLRALLGSVNAATVPLVLRDDLARLIPGFDPATAGLVARVAAIPLTVKLATAAAGVGVVVTGATELSHPRAHPVDSRAGVVRPAVVPAQGLELETANRMRAAGGSPLISPRALSSARHEDEVDEREEREVEEPEEEEIEVERPEAAEAEEPEDRDEGRDTASAEEQDEPEDSEDNSGHGSSDD